MYYSNNKIAIVRTSGLQAITAVWLMICCSVALAVDNTVTAASAENETAYMDSVNDWGTWELGIEPAAGPQAVTTRVLAVRPAGVQFRPNDNAAYRPGAVEMNTNMPLPGNPPAPIPMIPPGTAQGTVGAVPPTGDPRNR